MKGATETPFERVTIMIQHHAAFIGAAKEICHRNDVFARRAPRERLANWHGAPEPPSIHDEIAKEHHACK